MRAHFQISALPAEPFANLFTLSEAELAQRGARRYVADSKPGFPCRVSLVDADPGERLILVPFTHHDVDSPYRASGPIFIREGARRAMPGVDDVPESVRCRLPSIRAYDEAGFLLGAEATEGRDLEAQVEVLL